MVDSKVREIGNRLREEDRKLVDYATIAAQSESLGFLTSVRTLRFYVNEGILPPPKKKGNTPVFPEDDILNLLLSIHLMKTRFHRSLAEIKTILHHQRAEPETLADKLSLLYEETQRIGGLQRVEKEWLVDAFLRSLTGQLTLYPRRRRGQGGPRDPGEVLLTEIIDDIEELGRWVPDSAGQPVWQSPEESLQHQPAGRARREGGSMKEKPPASAARSPTVVPVEPPEAALVAREREELFLQRLERNLAEVEKVYNPLEEKHYPLKLSSLDPDVDDPYQQVVKILKNRGVHVHELLEKLPHNRSTRYGLPGPGLFGRRKPRIILAGVVRSPIDEFLAGNDLEPLGPIEIQEVIREHVRASDAYHVLGILSTVGWSEEARQRLPRDENVAVVLVEQLDHGGWLLTHGLPKKLQGLAHIFDPEEFGEKVSRVFYRIIDEPELKVPGGHLEVSRLLEDLQVSREVLDKALKQVEQEDSRIRCVTIGGKEILKKDRY